MPSKPLVDKSYLLERFPGKGGWTYAVIPEIPPDPHAHFGWVLVNGSIDSYPIKHFKLQPLGNGKLFLPVKSSIRKKIKKEAGDTVHIILYQCQDKYIIPKEIEKCFELEPRDTMVAFDTLSDSAKKGYIDWIYESKTEETKANRIAEMMLRITKGLSLHANKAQ